MHSFPHVARNLSTIIKGRRRKPEELSFTDLHPLILFKSDDRVPTIGLATKSFTHELPASHDFGIINRLRLLSLEDFCSMPKLTYLLLRILQLTL